MDESPGEPNVACNSGELLLLPLSSWLRELVISGAKVRGEGTCFDSATLVAVDEIAGFSLDPIIGDCLEESVEGRGIDSVELNRGRILSRLGLVESEGTGGGTSRPIPDPTVCIEPLENRDIFEATE